MIQVPSTLTYFSSLEDIGNIINRSALPLLEAHQFSDPFLPNRHAAMEFSVQEMFDAAVKSIAHAILGRTAPKGQPNHPLQRAIIRWRMENRFSDEAEIKVALEGLLPAMVEQAYSEAKLRHQEWLDYVASKRSVVLYEHIQNLALWESVGNRHKAVAIKMRCNEGSLFERCLPVHYARQPPQTVSLKDYIEHMIGNVPEIEYDNQTTLLTKNYNHRNEKEWRLVIDAGDEQQAWLAIPHQQIQSVYIGAQVPDHICEQLDRHLAKFRAKFSVFKAKAKAREYALEFEKISDHNESGQVTFAPESTTPF